ncbi:MAG: DegV family protein, partial [Chloroflexota bacterium]
MSAPVPMTASSRNVGIITDTTACLPRELVERYSIEVVPIGFSLNGRAYLDEVDLTPAEFYELLPRQEKLPTTSPSSPGRYMEAIRRTALRCSNVLCITV